MGKNEKRYLSPAAMRLFAFTLCLSVVLSMVGCASEVPETTTTGSVTTTVTQVTTVQVTTTVSIPTTQPSGAATTSATMPTTVPTVTDPVQTTAPTVPTVPTESKTTEPKPTEAKPTEPKPTETVPTTPKPTEPKPTETVPTTPKPTEPKPTEPKPTEPKPTEPKPTKPTDSWEGDFSGQAHTPVDYDNRYMYSQLPEDLKLVYRKLDEAVKNLETKVSFDVDITYDNRHEVYYMYMADHPEYFYLDSTFAMTYGGGQFGFLLAYSDGQTSCGYKQEITEMTDAFRTSITAKKAIFDAEVERIISTIPADAPDVVKERIIYDYIQQAAHYNHDLDFENIRPAQDDFSAYGVLINKTGVCESYAEAFQVLCYAVGINCTAINGVANGGGHKWNAVELDGQWYQCDLTFDDPTTGWDDSLRHNFFNITTQEMTNERHYPDEGWPVPECTATKYSYANYFGED